jgi:sporulation protein YlmC with PRC-barrel domain
MTAGEVHLERLIGRKVHDADGKPVGRIEDVLAERVDLECVIQEYHLGPFALLERLSVQVTRILRGRKREPIRVRWDELDLSDVEHPVMRRDGRDGQDGQDGRVMQG